MDRRTFLTMGAAVGLSGCIGRGDAPRHADRSPRSPTPSPVPRTPSPTSGTPSPTPPLSDPREGLFDDFEDLSMWETSGGTVTADVDRYLTGTQSVRIEISADDERGAIDRQFDRPVDLTGCHFAMAIRSDSLAYPRLQLYDEDGNRVDFRCQVYPAIPLQLYDLGVFRVDGSPDLSAVSKLRIQEYTGGGEAVTVWLDAIHLGPRPDNGKVLVQFDDGSATNYTAAFPILEEYGYPATAFPNPNKVGKPDKLDLDQLGELQDAGWLVGNHTLDHPILPHLAREAQAKQIVGAKTWLVDHGFERGASYFAFPNGAYDASALAIVEDHHALSFGGGFPGYGELMNPILIARQGDYPPPEARAAIDVAAEWRGISTLFFHRLAEDSSTPTVAEFESIVEYLHEREASGDVDVVTPVDLEEALQSPVG